MSSNHVFLSSDPLASRQANIHPTSHHGQPLKWMDCSITGSGQGAAGEQSMVATFSSVRGGSGRERRKRGGMGGRDEDEGFVYGDLVAGDGSAVDGEVYIDRRRRRSAYSVFVEMDDEAGNGQLGGSGLSVSISHASDENGDENPIPLPRTTDSQRENDDDFEQRGAEKRQNKEYEKCIDLLSPATPSLGSIDHPHSSIPLLVIRQLHHKESDRIIESYSKISIPASFTIPFHSPHARSITFLSPAAVYHFPHGATRDHLVRISRIDGYTGDDVNVIRVVAHEMECELKSALARYWKSLGGKWEWLCVRSLWQGEGKGDTYIVSKRDIVFGDGEVREEDGLGMRGRHIQTPFPEWKDYADEFGQLCGNSAQKGCDDCGRSSASTCTQDWMKVASIVQARNRVLEREIEEYKHVNDSLLQDVDWQLHMQADLEEQLMVAKDEKLAALTELQALKIRLARSSEISASLSMTPDLEESEEYLEEGRSTCFWSGIRGAPHHTTPYWSCHEESTNIDTSLFGDEHVHANHPSTTVFYFFPRVSTIALLIDPVRYFRWPRNTTLQQIREMLEYRHAQGVENDPHAQIIRQIMETREEMGIQLPDVLGNDVVLIEIPDFVDDLNISAWKAFDLDDRRVDADQSHRSAVGDGPCFLSESSDDDDNDNKKPSQSSPRLYTPKHPKSMAEVNTKPDKNKTRTSETADSPTSGKPPPTLPIPEQTPKEPTPPNTSYPPPHTKTTLSPHRQQNSPKSQQPHPSLRKHMHNPIHTFPPSPALPKATSSSSSSSVSDSDADSTSTTDLPTDIPHEDDAPIPFPLPKRRGRTGRYHGGGGGGGEGWGWYVDVTGWDWDWGWEEEEEEMEDRA